METYRDILNEKYAKKLMSVLMSGLGKRDEIMDKAYEESISDPSLTDSKKKLFKEFYVIYELASFRKYETLSDFLMAKKPNIPKIIKSRKRLKRSIGDIESVLDGTNLKRLVWNDWLSIIEGIPELMTTFKYKGLDNLSVDIKDDYGYDYNDVYALTYLFIVTLSSFLRNKPSSLQYKWFAYVCISTIHQYAKSKPSTLPSTDHLKRIDRIFGLFNLLVKYYLGKNKLSESRLKDI